MLIERFVSEGLAHNSYVVADGGEAAVIDPRRDVDAYLDFARENALRIRYVLETHRNEDYVIGSSALAKLTGATVLHSSRLAFDYGTPVREGDRFGVGSLELRVLETPGHTDESLCFALGETKAHGDAFMVFTGDTLFVDEVGRIDLYGESERPRLAAALYESLFGKILPLGDGVILAPAHGGGSVCGGHISARQHSTLGYERRHNPRLVEPGREAFARALLDQKLVRPPYFRRMEELNERGDPAVFARAPSLVPLRTGEFEERLRAGAIAIDARMPQAFAGGHVPGSYNVWLEGLSIYLPWVVSHDTPLVLVLPEGASVEGVARTLLRIGFDRVEGYLRGGFTSWQEEGREIAHVGTLSTAELRRWVESQADVAIVDVRQPGEWERGLVPGARPIFVGELEQRIDELPRDRPVVTMCSSGNRGGIGASILARHGFHHVFNYLGGFGAWKASGLQTVKLARALAHPTAEAPFEDRDADWPPA